VKKVLFISIMVIMVMALVLPACAPAAPPKPATPPAAPAATPPPAAPADAKYTNTDYGFVITYPGTWKSTPSAIPTTVFFAQGPGGAFDDFVQVNVRPGADFKQAAIDWATEQVTAKKIDAKPAVIAEKAVKIGGMDGKQVTIEVDAIIMKLGSVYYGFVKDGKVVMVNVAGVIKPNVDKYAVWQKILDGITWGGAAAAPAAPAAPAAAPPPAAKPLSYEAETFTSDLGFSFKYPKAWKVASKPYATAVFYANDGAIPLPDLVFVDVRDGTSVKDAAVKSLTDFVVAKGVSTSPTVESEKTITLADGTQATEIVVVAEVLMMKKKGAAVGAVKGGKTYVVLAGVDTGKLDLWKEMAGTLTFK
jgi:hypothetical protein